MIQLQRAGKRFGHQRSEFLPEHGFLDAVVKRGEMKAYIAPALRFFCD